MVILALFFTEPMWCCAEPDVVLDGLLSRLNQGKRAEVESHQASFAVFFSALHMWFANLFVLTGLFIGQCRVGQFMIQNSKVVHWPDKQPETAELKWLIRDESIQSSALSYPNRILLLLLTRSWFFRRLAAAVADVVY